MIAHQLTILALLIIGVSKDTTVKQSPMHIRNHRTDISRRVRFTILWEFDTLQITRDGRVKVHGVSFVERVDFTSGWNLDIPVGEDEFTERFVECETVDSLTGGKDQVAR